MLCCPLLGMQCRHLWRQVVPHILDLTARANGSVSCELLQNCCSSI